jgi:hypothetical protein
MNTYRLNSTEWVYTPSMIKMAQEQFSFDPKWSLNLLVDGYNLPKSIATQLLTGKIQFKIEGEAVVFTA